MVEGMVRPRTGNGPLPVMAAASNGNNRYMTNTGNVMTRTGNGMLQIGFAPRTMPLFPWVSRTTVSYTNRYITDCGTHRTGNGMLQIGFPLPNDAPFSSGGLAEQPFHIQTVTLPIVARTEPVMVQPKPVMARTEHGNKKHTCVCYAPNRFSTTTVSHINRYKMGPFAHRYALKPFAQHDGNSTS